MRKLYIASLFLLLTVSLYAEEGIFGSTWMTYNDYEKASTLKGVFATILFIGESLELAESKYGETLNRFDKHYIDTLGRLKKCKDEDFEAMVKYLDYFYYISENKEKNYYLAIVSFLDQNNIH